MSVFCLLIDIINRKLRREANTTIQLPQKKYCLLSQPKPHKHASDDDDSSAYHILTARRGGTKKHLVAVFPQTAAFNARNNFFDGTCRILIS